MGFGQLKTELLDTWPKEGGDRDMALAAWASSFDKEKAEARTDADVERVVRQLIEHVHDTPKETVWLKFFFTVPIFIERQFDKYRMTVQTQDFRLDWYNAPFGRLGITQNELSGRYRTIPDRPYTLPDDVREYLREAERDLPNTEEMGEKADLLNLADAEFDNHVRQQHEWYEAILLAFPPEWRSPKNPNNYKYRRVREVLRGILGTAYLTDMRIVMNLNAFEHIVNQRIDPAAQMESRVVAYQMVCAALDKKVAPVAIAEMMVRNGWADHMEAIAKHLATYGDE